MFLFASPKKNISCDDVDLFLLIMLVLKYQYFDTEFEDSLTSLIFWFTFIIDFNEDSSRTHLFEADLWVLYDGR